MNSSEPNEDLFETSRMSFGEHLEELRTTLVRSVIGVAICCIFGFWFAEEVVQILTSPLEEAQISFQRENAELRYQEELGHVPPEFMPLLKRGLVPRLMMVNPDQIRQWLNADTGEPIYTPSMVTSEFLRPSHFRDGGLLELGKELVDPSDPENSQEVTAIWQQLSETEQQAFERIANTPKLSKDELEQAREKILESLNRICAEPGLYQSQAFSELLNPPGLSWKTILAKKDINVLADLKKTVEDESRSELERANALRNLNRNLIRQTFPDLIQAFELNVVPVEFWEQVDYKPQALWAGESFFVWLKAGLFTGLTIAGPFVFYQLWSFVAAGLYPHEKKYIHWFLPISIILFVGGVLLAFFFVFEPVLQFLFSFNRALGIAPEMRIGEWLSFAMFLPLGFGVAFQLPLVMLFANRIGLIEIQTYIEKWRIAVMVIFVLAMFLTPADPISLLLLAIPLSFLYFLGIMMCKWMPRPQNPFADTAAVIN